MSLMFDRDFVNMYIANRLDLFGWARDNLGQFRCPLCGDSQKNKTKRRGFFYADSGNDILRFKCHNCSECSGWGLGAWLTKFDVTLAQQYNFEKFKSGNKPQKVDLALKPKKKKTVRKTVTFGEPTKQLHQGLVTNSVRLSELPRDHMAVAYMLGRKIPERLLEELWYTDNFREFSLGMGSYETTVAEKMPADKRIVIPFYEPNGEDLYCYQGRALEDSILRYATVKHKENAPKLYGLDRLQLHRTKLVVEGPIDSMFLPNCVATADSNLLSYERGDIYIPDNQYRNPEICKGIEKIIAAGKSIVLFPKEFEDYKDINDFITEGGMSTKDLLKIVAQNNYKGLKAKAVWAKLKGV